MSDSPFDISQGDAAGAAAAGAHASSAQEELRHREVEATVGGGMVTVRANGQHGADRGEASIPQAVDPRDVEMLQDLIVAAVNQAMTRAQEDGAGGAPGGDRGTPDREPVRRARPHGMK